MRNIPFAPADDTGRGTAGSPASSAESGSRPVRAFHGRKNGGRSAVNETAACGKTPKGAAAPRRQSSSGAASFLAKAVVVFILLLIFQYFKQSEYEAPDYKQFQASLQTVIDSAYGQRTAASASAAGYSGEDASRNGTAGKSESAGKRRRMFTTATGINDAALFLLYEQADRDGNHTLSLTEITDFQKEVCSRFAYRENTSALPPNRFLSSGGGDCEDWALLTCGLLRYWGYECSLAVFSSRDPEEPGAHALAFLYSHSPPASGEYYFLDEETVLRLSHYSKNPATSGYYLPIDYTHVGSLSSAVAPHWVLSSLYCPEEVYGDPL